MTGIDAFLSVLHASGVPYIFGNPGTTELPLNDALARRSDVRYIFGLHEIPVLAMADGFAQASGVVGVANVHSACGLGNAMGMLYNAHVAGTPLLLTAGSQDRRLAFGEPVLSGDLVSVARPWTKWSYEIQRVEDVPAATRRALQVALTPPTGPVFLAMPLDLQSESREVFDLSAALRPNRRIRPSADALQCIAQILVAAENPAILAGSRVTESGAIEALVALAELLGTTVFTECTTIHGRAPFPSAHPLAGERIRYWSPEVREQLRGHDVLLVVGAHVLRMYIHHEPERPLPESLRLLQIDSDPWQIGKNYPVEAGIQADPKCALEELAEAVSKRMSPSHTESANRRYAQAVVNRSAKITTLQTRIREQQAQRPMTPQVVMHAIAQALPKDVAIIDEGITTTGTTLEDFGAIADPYVYFAHRGWALGWGIGFALGVKLAWPDRPTVALLGDGAALYGIQGLWSAAHHKLPVVFVVCNNAQYRILKVCGDLLPLPQMHVRNYLAMDLTKPEVDFVALAKSFGVVAHRVESPEELTARVRAGFESGEPVLLDVAVAR
jgi:benzoylformate decarboxylase